MTFKVKEAPKKIYESVTFQFIIEDENGEELELRKWEDGNGGGYYIYHNNLWIDFYPDENLEEFIDENLEF